MDSVTPLRVVDRTLHLQIKDEFLDFDAEYTVVDPVESRLAKDDGLKLGLWQSMVKAIGGFLAAR